MTPAMRASRDLDKSPIDFRSMIGAPGRARCASVRSDCQRCAATADCARLTASSINGSAQPLRSGGGRGRMPSLVRFALVVQDGPLPGQEYEIRDPIAVIGRSASADTLIIVPDESFSDRRARRAVPPPGTVSDAGDPRRLCDRDRSGRGRLPGHTPGLRAVQHTLQKGFIAMLAGIGTLPQSPPMLILSVSGSSLRSLAGPMAIRTDSGVGFVRSGQVAPRLRRPWPGAARRPAAESTRRC
jgi:hypothetical protein